MSNTNVQENKMGVMPVNKLLLSMSLPMMLSMLVQALYNIVDSIYVARICEDALTAVSLAFPMQSLMIALGGGTGVGINALLSRALGEGDKEKANKAAINGVFLALLSFIVFLIIGFAVTEPFYKSQTDDPEIVEFGIKYLKIVSCCSIGLYTQFVFERLLQSTGKTFYAMITQTVGAVINIILDPILIFGLLGAPELGVAGAAIATVVGQIVAGIVAVIINIKKNDELHLDFRKFKPDWRIIGQIYRVGIPSIIMQSIGSIMVYCMNRILIVFSTTATAVFGVYFKLQSFIFMPVFGLNNGMVPIIAYNYGARKKQRLIKTMKLSVFYAMALMLVGFLAFQIFPETLLGFFEASPDMLAMGVPALRIISMHFLIAGFCIISGSTFQALGNGIYSMITSFTRQIIVLIPAAYLLSLLGNVDYVWWSFPIAELASMMASIFFLVRVNKKIISKLD